MVNGALITSRNVLQTPAYFKNLHDVHFESIYNFGDLWWTQPCAPS